MKILTLIASLVLLTTTALSQATNACIDGWRVENATRNSNGTSNFSLGRVYDSVNNRTTFNYRVYNDTSACDVSNGAGVLQRITLPLTSCFPALEVVSTSVTPANAATVMVNPGRTATNQSPWGVVFDVNSSASDFTFSYTLKGDLSYGEVNFGVSDDDGSCALCGATKKIRGVGCPIATGYCQATGNKADIAVMVDQSKCMAPSTLTTTIPTALTNFLDGLGTAAERARFAMGSFYWAGGGETCRFNADPSQCTESVSHFTNGFANLPGRGEVFRYSNLRSLTVRTDANGNNIQPADPLSEGDRDEPITGALTGFNPATGQNETLSYTFDYDGYARTNYGKKAATGLNCSQAGTCTNSYRLVQDTFVKSCGDAPVGAAIEVGHQHLFYEGWTDPQTPNYLILISTGVFNKTIGNTAQCTSSTYLTAAADEAVAKASAAKAQGTRIITILYPGANCTSIASGRTLLRDTIATAASVTNGNSNFYEVGVNGTLNQILTNIRNRSDIKQSYTCPNPDGVNICDYTCNDSALPGPGGKCVPIWCPGITPTPTPTPLPPTPTPTSTPITPFCIEDNFNIFNQQLDLDQLGHEFLEQIKDATRFLVRKIAGNNSKLKASFQKAGKKAYSAGLKEFNDNNWSVIWNELKSSGKTVTNTNACTVACNLGSNVAVKTKLTTSAGKLSSLVNSMLKRVPKNVSRKLKKEVARKKAKNAATLKQYTEIAKIIPDNVCK